MTGNSVLESEAAVVRVLLVEDDEDDYLIVRDLLSAQERTPFEVEWASTYEDARTAIAERRHDVYLVDYRLGPSTGLSLIRQAFGDENLAPIIMLTGHVNGRGIDLEAADLGVADFIAKDKLDPALLERSIRYAISHSEALAALRESRSRFALAVEGANDGVWDWDIVADKTYLAPRWKEILGCDDLDLEDGATVWLERVHPDDLDSVMALVDGHLNGHTTHFQSEHRMRHADGEYRWVLSRGLAVRGEDGVPTRMAGSMSDINARKVAEEQLRHGALHDSLTGLPNRTLFLDRLDHGLGRAKRSGGGLSILFVDVDRFKLINDSYSHAVGDELLISIAGRLDTESRPGDTVARLGGDEFVLLLEGVKSDRAAIAIAERMHTTLARPFSVSGKEIGISVSTGIAISAASAQADELMRDADIAMYYAKQNPDSAIAVFDASMHRRVVARHQVETDLRQILEAGSLDVAYQPIVELASRKITGFEALARWPSERPAVSPSEFISVAEDTGLIRRLGLFVLDRACAQLADWRLRGVVSSETTMSVNVSGHQFAGSEFVDSVKDALGRHGVPGGALRIEMTESTVIDAPDQMVAGLARLGELDVKAQLDDFGAGYASLTFLHRFSGEGIKIDRSFVAKIESDTASQQIVRAIVDLAHHLGLSVIAEGVETTGQASILDAIGCEFAQGYLFGEPLYPGALEAKLVGATALSAD